MIVGEAGTADRRSPQAHVARALRIAGFGGLFTLAGFAGRATIVDGGTLSLVWPAAGVAVLWFLVEEVHWRSVDVLALAGLAFVVNASTGSSAVMGCVLVAANVAQALVAVLLCRRWGAGLCGQGAPLATTRSLMTLVAAAMTGCAVGTAVGVTGLWLADFSFGLASTLIWWGRNAVGIVGVTVVGLLLLDRWAAGGRLWPRRHAIGWWVELGAVLAVTGLLYAIEMLATDLPVSFLLPGVLVWVGLRFSPTVAALHGLVAGAGFVAVTLAGHGPFAEVASVRYSALLSQLFVGLSVVVGMTVAIYRAQTTRLLGEVRHARRASQAQADILGTVIASMGDGVCVLDHHGVVRMANPALGRTVGAPVTPGTPALEALVLQGPDGHALAPDDLPIGRALAGEVVAGVDCVVGSSQGSRTVHVSATPLGEPGGRGAVVVVRDVTDERAHQRELAGFAGVVAHDLLNPIGAVDGWAEQLEETVEVARGADGALELQMVHRIRGAAQRMRSLVRDLLAHATSTDHTLHPETLDLAALAEDVALERGAARQVLIGVVPPVEGDPVLVRQLLDNLIGNAVKYVAPGCEPEVEVAGERAPGGGILVRVDDRGIGIPAGEHEVVFGSFQRAHGVDYPGTGLGLAICRRIVERHGGTIVALPRPGGGTSMVLTLPAAVTAPLQVRASGSATG